jgi:hypothetical protein
MRIGLASVFPWRPHTEHMVFLGRLLQQAGHTTVALSCDSGVDRCYQRITRSAMPGWLNCAMCRLGSVRTFDVAKVTSVRPHNTIVAQAREWSKSSVSTLLRYETDAEYLTSEFSEMVDALAPSVSSAYLSALDWIEKERLDSIVLFNGRIDLTKGILEAAKTANIPFVTFERTWFGDGLQLLPNESCLGLKSIDRLTHEWADKPLLATQAEEAATRIASRFARTNTNEWRAYNVNATQTPWPAKGERRVLFVPGSRCEVWGNEDWVDAWPSRTEGFDSLIEQLDLKPEECVLRCHPNWKETIHGVTGAPSERMYVDWAARRGIAVIESGSSVSTLGLIEESDAIVVSAGSAALEAGALGKQVFAMGPSWYQRAGFETTVNPATLSSVRMHLELDEKQRLEQADATARKTLRFSYSINNRIPQYVQNVKSVSPTEYRYAGDPDPMRLHDLLTTGVLMPDDSGYSDGLVEENAILQRMADRNWMSFHAEPNPAADGYSIHRRLAFRGVDLIRDRFARGDRLELTSKKPSELSVNPT